jgi:outer membrane protein assembly factor BamB
MASRSTKRDELLVALPLSSRRQFLKRSVAMSLSIPAVGSLLAACGDDDDDEPTAISAGDDATATEEAIDEVTPTEEEMTDEATPTEATAESTSEPGGATPALACPSGEYPTAGALSISDGAVEWSVCSPDEAYRTVLGASDDVVLIEESGPVAESGATSRRTIAFEATGGSERWRRSTGETPTPAGPIDGQGIVVLADQDALALVGVDVVTGEEQWRVESSEAPLANSHTVTVVWDVTGPGTPSRFRGVDRATGDELWVSDTLLSDQSGNQVARSPAAVLGEVVVIPTGATVTAIDMQTGATLWQAPQLDDPAAADGTIVGTRGTNGPPHLATVTALDAASGQERWTAPGLPSYRDLLAVGDGVIVVLDPGSSELVAYELPSGNDRWRATQTSATQPQLISGTSLVMLWESELAVLSTTDGATLWSTTQPFGSPLMNSVGSNGDSVFVAINSLPWTD